jgi:hypothetical protein
VKGNVARSLVRGKPRCFNFRCNRFPDVSYGAHLVNARPGIFTRRFAWVTEPGRVGLEAVLAAEAKFEVNLATSESCN